MGRGTRHSKNAGVMGSEGLSYHERKAMGYGTLSERLGKDAQGNYNDCALTLQPAKDPMITSEGHLFSKEAIMQYFLDQKKLRQAQLAEWEADQARLVSQGERQQEQQRQAELAAFEKRNVAMASDRTASTIVQQGHADASEAAKAASVQRSGLAIRANEDRAKSVQSFWQPGDTPDSDRLAEKPKLDVVCPVTGNKLKLKDLTPVKFTPLPDGDGAQFMDPITKDVFTNSSHIVVLKPTGDAMLEKTYKSCVKPDGHFNGHKVKEKDVVKLVGGGTGFAGGPQGQKLKSERHYTLGPGTGREDLRGQAAAGQSRFGLAFHN